MKVLVVGAGPTGLTAALALRRRGIKADIIDKRDQSSPLSRAVGILPRSLHLLEPFGVAQALVEEGIKFRGVNLYDGAKQFAQVEISVRNVQYGYDYVLGLAQDRTEFHLRAGLEALGEPVRYGEALLDLSQTDDVVTATTSTNSQLDYDYVIGADGGSSKVRDLVGLKLDGFELPEDWSIADIDAEGWRHPDTMTIALVENGAVAIVAPMEAKRYRVVSNTPDALATLPLDISPTHIRRESRFQIFVGLVPTYRKGRVFLAGDAAHTHSPVGGRGMNLGIADAVDLAARIAEGGLETYSQERRAEGARVLRLSERGRKTVSSKNPLVRGSLRTAAKLAARNNFIRQRIAAGVLYG